MRSPFRVVTLSALLAVHSAAAVAQNSFQHSGQSVAHSAEAFGHALVGGAKLVSGIAAIPLQVLGQVGRVSGEAGDAMWEVANAPAGEPLPVTDDVVTAGPPPSVAIKQPARSP